MAESLEAKHYRLTHCPTCGRNGPDFLVKDFESGGQDALCGDEWHSLFDDAPRVGDDVYLRTALYMGHGRDDFIGGLCKVTKVFASISGGEPTVSIQTKEREGWSHNWKFLKEEQEELRKRFGDQRGRPDPDLRPEFNDW